MFSILDGTSRLCDGVSRREMLRIGGLSTLGLSLTSLLRAAESPSADVSADPTFGRAKNVIYVWLQGGPPQHETFDPKPEAPADIRGPFKPIQTNIPGINFSELLPRTARMADKLAVVRSMHTDSNIHSVSAYEILTGYKYQGANARMISHQDWPYFGSMVKMLRPSTKLPALSTVWIPQLMRLNENVTPAGQTSGFMGRQWEPDRFLGDPSDPNYHVEGLDVSDLEPMRLQQRMSLLKQVERHFGRLERGKAIGVYDRYQSQAFDLLSSGTVQRAFDLENESDTLRDRYGRTKWGQCLLLARRLVEVGVRMVHVNWTRESGDSAVDNPMWDTHAQNADRVEDVLCPMFDVGFSTLINDLDQRGLLDETLVVAIGEFGRTPKINANAGRDHWGSVFSFALAGAGIQAGQVYGASDKNGAYPARDAVTPADLTATIFHLIGLNHETMFRNLQGRELRVTSGAPIRAVLGNEVATTNRNTPGGDIARVPPYSGALLLNSDFTDLVPLRPTNLGSRPKGWRAVPLWNPATGDAFSVNLFGGTEGESLVGKQHVGIGFGIAGGTAPTIIKRGDQALLAQEMRNPRLGRFRFTVKASGHAVSKEFYEQVFLKNFTCRLVIFRFNKSSKNPQDRTDFISVPIEPAFSSKKAPVFEEFQVEKLLDSPGPGQNFPIGNGYGVAVVVEKTSEGRLALSEKTGPHTAYVRIDGVRLEFNSRTINDKVKI